MVPWTYDVGTAESDSLRLNRASSLWRLEFLVEEGRSGMGGKGLALWRLEEPDVVLAAMRVFVSVFVFMVLVFVGVGASVWVLLSPLIGAGASLFV